MNELKVIGREHIGHIEFTGIEGGFGKDKKAMLVKDIALIHGQPLGEINRRINDNRERFKNGIDIIDLKSVMGLSHNEFGYTQNAWNRSANAYLLSERGYSKLLKILEDDKAWEVYDQLVDGYFTMRAEAKATHPRIDSAKRLEIMSENAQTRKGALLYRIAMQTKSETSKQALLAKAAEAITGEMTIPVLLKKEYSATAVAQKLGTTANKVGRTANQIGIKAEQPGQNKYGRWANSKSQHSDKEVPQWLYFDEGVKAIAKAINSAKEAV
ncbi:MAG: ORF6N domain-containing protein [Lactobacillus sp.]|jgi:Trp operon repressor|nr:ORF6N domain-containing protein [Lactobacillus sp.]MCI1941480.1 ORF6N domain-containing protein [Lactobacillus sp.]MCI1972009.1 ORF6N domain-containing protein [Lactobacillus sp.]MCI2016148.1 ORF6N domain-containing protein [Lactobacillus sp.]MCI2036419.1 ORF6N domain-containing protein [Lactobacillus sp.]